MAELNPAIVKKTAELARLHLTDEETERFTAQLSKVLVYINKLDEIDTKGIEPLSHAVDSDTAFRADEPKKGPGPEAIMSNAPEEVYGNFKVPQVIAQGAE